MIRECTHQDLDRLLRLYTQLHDDPPSDPDGRARAVWQRICSDPSHHVIVADEGGELAASCICVIIPNLTRGQRPYALIENVVTARAFRRRGLGTACLAYAKQLAERENCYKLMLLTGSREEATLRFYRRAGYNDRDKTAFIQWL